jgi:hypothetical protein
LDVNIGLVIACLPSLRPYFGSRDKPEDPRREVRCKEPSGKLWAFGERAVHLHSKQHDEEGSPSSSSGGSNVRGFVDCAEMESCEDRKSNASDTGLVHVRLPDVAKMGAREGGIQT